MSVHNSVINALIQEQSSYKDLTDIITSCLLHSSYKLII